MKKGAAPCHSLLSKFAYAVSTSCFVDLIALNVFLSLSETMDRTDIPKTRVHQVHSK
jgi:hypothetical protein